MIAKHVVVLSSHSKSRWICWLTQIYLKVYNFCHWGGHWGFVWQCRWNNSMFDNEIIENAVLGFRAKTWTYILPFLTYNYIWERIFAGLQKHYLEELYSTPTKHLNMLDVLNWLKLVCYLFQSMWYTSDFEIQTSLWIINYCDF